MKLYVVNGAPNARKVQAVVNHLGLPVEQIFLDFFKGETKSPAYLQINPAGRVPALVHDDFTLWESNAINKYLCAQCPDNTLYPADPRVQADIDRWLSWELAHFNQQLGILTFQTVAKPVFLGEQPNEPLVNWSMQMLSGHAKLLEGHLDGRQYVVGDAVTLADYAMAHIESMKDMTPFDWSPYPNINAYFDRMRDVEHFARTGSAPEQTGRVPTGATAFSTMS
ncbi:MAG: glutathione S-transferase family protein [Wenzhouxiangellaceae bacterium]